MNITYSALAPYLNAREIDTTGGPAANAVNPTLDAVYRCPSDNLGARPSTADASHGTYRYSYAININYANPIQSYGGFAKGQRIDGVFTGKIASIRSSAEKLLFVCEDEWSLNDGCFQADATGWVANKYVDNVSTRHESKIRNTVINNPSGLIGSKVNQDGNGNVVFCDGHGSFFSRKDAMRARYSGNPVPDPAGF